jgi:hypothetical protein
MNCAVSDMETAGSLERLQIPSPAPFLFLRLVASTLRGAGEKNKRWQSTSSPSGRPCAVKAASRERSRRRRCPASSAPPAGARRHEDSRCSVRSSGGDPGRVDRQRRSRRLRRGGRRRGVRGAAAPRAVGRADDKVFHRREDAGTGRPWRARRIGPQGRESAPLRATRQFEFRRAGSPRPAWPG